MAVEIERRYLLADDTWRNAVTKSETFEDGLMARFGGAKLRVRLASDRAWIAIKGARSGFSRAEFEYEVPVSDAREMLAILCHGPIVQKTRHCVPFGGLIWSVDIHAGLLEGLAFAEVELVSEDQEPLLPPWIGREITHDPEFKKEALFRRWVVPAPSAHDQTSP